MDEEISIINEKTRNEKIKNFFVKNKRLLLLTISSLVIIVLGFYSFQAFKENQREQLSDTYNSAVIKFNEGDRNNALLIMKKVIENRDATYSPLALYFLIDNNLLENQNETNDLFDVLIDKTSLEKEIKNLIIYKKALFNANFSNEKQLLDILKPLLNSKSVWKSHALYLIAEYFYSKNEKQKSKEFFNEILNTENANQDLIKEAQKRLNRDLSD
tara:strand:+ start:429 stop:1073 length:645 start_codon:yes stop_codon:yes gene_type:complete